MCLVLFVFIRCWLAVWTFSWQYSHLWRGTELLEKCWDTYIWFACSQRVFWLVQCLTSYVSVIYFCVWIILLHVKVMHLRTVFWCADIFKAFCMIRSRKVFGRIPYWWGRSIEAVPDCPNKQPRMWSVSDIMLLISAHVGTWPTVSLKALSSRWQYTVSVFIVAESSNQCLIMTKSFLRMLDCRRNIA